MKSIAKLLRANAICFIAAVPCSGSEIFISQKGNVEILSITQPSPGEGFLATKIVLRSSNSDARMATWGDISFTGNNLHQVWLNGPFPSPTSSLDDLTPERANPDWVAYDSHLLFSTNEIAGSIGGGLGGIEEDNDGSSFVDLTLLRNEFPALTGFGGIRQPPGDAFFLDPALVGSSRELAYLVTLDDGSANESILLTVSVLGEGLDPDPDVQRNSFGFNENLYVSFTTEPSASIACVAILVGVLWLRRPRR